MPVPRLSREHTALLVVDVQEKVLPHIYHAAAVAQQAGLLIDGANVLGLPVIVTEHYPKGLGPTVAALAGKLAAAHPAGTFEKLKFSAVIEPVRAALASAGARSVLVCGIEAHVCVLQTCLDLIDSGYVTAVALDAIGSRRRTDRDAAVARLVQAGVVPTSVESALLEMVHEASGPVFKSILSLIK